VRHVGRNPFEKQIPSHVVAIYFLCSIIFPEDSISELCLSVILYLECLNKEIVKTMKHLYVFLIVSILLNTKLISQQYVIDTRVQNQKEDEVNLYRSDQVTNLDLLQALELSGIRIHKFQIGKFDKKYGLLIMISEIKDGKEIKTDTVFNGYNDYDYYKTGGNEFNTDFIDQIKIISKVEDTTLIFYFSTYGQSFKERLHYEKYEGASFYNIRSYTDTKWCINEKIPLLIFASSWKDKQGGFQRFCGAVNLSRNDEKTDELLSSSPHYFLISYLVKEFKN